jgi:hypothetical protein
LFSRALAEFDQYAMGASRMQKNHPLTFCARPRLPERSETLRYGASQSGVQILYLETQMMNAFTPFFQESSDRTVGGEGFQKLEMRVADRQERGPNLLGFDRFPVGADEAQPLLVGSNRGIQVPYRNADVVQTLHGATRLPSIAWIS